MSLEDLVFCHVDDALVDLVIKLAHGHLIVDCGAGYGLLGKKLLERGVDVLSIDLFPPDETLSPVVPLDATKMKFVKGMFLVFLRPCHSDWVAKTVTAVRNDCHCLYVSLPKNRKNDLRGIPKSLKVLYQRGWKGKDGEHAYLIRPAKAPELYKYALVTCSGETLWCEVRDGEYYNFAGGHLPKSITVHEEVEAARDEDLDWTKTSLIKEHSEAGWLSPEGRFYGCDSRDHDRVARFILHQSVEELEKTWVRVYGEHGCTSYLGMSKAWITFGRLTAEQRNWLTEHGHDPDWSFEDEVPSELVDPDYDPYADEEEP